MTTPCDLERFGFWATRRDGDVRFHTCWARNLKLLEENLVMSDHTQAPEDADDQRGSEPEAADEDEIAAKMRAVMRAQETHREGGVDPDLEEAGDDPEPDA
jgi:hypothetical protein